MKWSTACPDWEKRIVNRESLIPFEPLFPEQAKRALDIFKSLKMVDVLGQPTFGEACAPWVFDFVAAIFGAYDENTGKQLINEFFLLISKKNGKSTIAAAIMITALILNMRHSAELLILAPTKEVADNSYKPASDIVKASPELSRFLKTSDHIREIKHLNTNATLKVVAAENDTVTGKKASFVLIDELWLFGKKEKADNMLKEATGGLVSRPEGFVIYLSTHSDNPPAGVFKKKLEEFRNIRDGVVENHRALGVLYEFPKRFLQNEDYLNPDNFYITNPSLGYSVDAEDLLSKLNKETDEQGRRVFLAKHLNVEIGQAQRGDRWVGTEFWQRQTDETLTYDSLMERSEVVVVGIDGGGLDDLYGLSLIGRDKQTKHWLSWSHAWAHESVLQRRKSIATVLLDFESDGDLTIVNDSLNDISQIIEIIEDVKVRGLLACVAVDPAGLGELIENLAELDITPENKQLIGVPQGFGMMNAIKTTERKVAGGTFWHSKSAMMDWCVANLKIEPTATAIRATKQNAGDAKIDPAMAMFDAATVMSRNPAALNSGTIDQYFASLGGGN
ncbi:terminase large subunit [Bartonella sp. W8097]|uniref:terminase large subunit n=1 Tax=Bartonella apihabitans TaxID=2750929 RepID=UPI0018DE5063|nr:terminase large subunit [Bartonella apihabitans]MBI0021015.1 terminase large subunit [Bartonella apihabitans]